MERDNEILEPPKEMIQGFNEGYLLAKEMPEFAHDMAKFLPESDRGNGFRDGIKQYSYDLAVQKNTNMRRDFKDNKNAIGLDKNNAENRTKHFRENRDDMGVGTSKDHLTGWLKRKEENKCDLGVSRDKDHYRDEPELD